MTDQPLRIMIDQAGLTITRDNYLTHDRHHAIADRVMTTFGYDPNDVTEIRLNEGAVEVDVAQRSGQIVTHRHELGLSSVDRP